MPSDNARNEPEELAPFPGAFRQDLLDALPGAFYVLDHRGAYVLWNAFQRDRIAGKTDGEMRGASALETVHAEDRPAVEAALRSALDRGTEEALECRVLLRGGPEFLWMRVTGRRLMAQGQPFLVGMGTDVTQRRAAELTLEEERARLAAIIEGTRVGTWEWNLPTGEVVFNARWAEIIGYTLEELEPLSIETWRRFTHPDDLRRSDDLVRRHLQGDLPYYESMARMRHKLGHWIWVLDRGRVAVRSTNGSPVKMIGTHTDVTAQRESELRTQESLLFQREAERIARIGAWKVSPQTDFLHWTEGIYEILEIPCDRHFGLEEGLRFYDAESVPLIREALARALQDGSSFVIETGLTTATGKHIWTEVRGLGRIEEGGQALVMGTFQDITARKEAVEALRESEQRLRLALQAGRQGLFDLDIPSGRTLVNDEYARMLGHDPRRFVESHKQWLARLHPDDVSPCQSAFEGYISGHLPEYRVEFRQRTASGAWKWVLSTGLIVGRDPAGRPVRMLGTHLDIDDRKQAEERTRLLRDLGLRLVSVSDVPAALRLTLEAALAIGSAEAGGIYQVEKTTGDLVLAHHVGISRRFASATWRIPANSPNTAMALRNAPYHGNTAFLVLPQASAVRHEGLRAFSSLPITVEGRLLAVLNLASRNRDELPPACHTTLESVANVLGSVLVRLEAQDDLRRANAELERRVTERTRELARSETKFRTLFESSRDAIITAGPTGALLDCNPAAIQLFGFGTKAELLSRSLVTLSAERQSDGRSSNEVFHQIQEAILSQGSLFYEWDLRRAEGSVFPAEISMSVAMIDGQPVLRALIRDISQRRAAEAQLRASEARFRQLLQMAPLPFGLVSHDGEITFLNHRYTQLFGYTRETLPTIEHWWRAAYPDTVYRQQVQDRWATAVARAETENTDIEPLEYRVTCADGRCLDVIVSGVRLGSDLLATFLDVTQLRAADAALRKLRSAVEHSPAVVVITDPLGRIEYVNPAFEAQTGYTAEEAIGQNPRLLKSGVHPVTLFTELWQTLLSGRVWRGELCSCRKDGTLFWESTSVAPVFDDQGSITHFVAVKQDITEQRRAAEELNKAKEEAEAASRAKGRFLANMSHEIRTPMNVILGFAQLMQRDPALDPRHRQHLETISRSGEHLLRLLNDVLDMSRIEADRLPMVPVDFDFHALLDEVTAMFRLRTGESGIDFEVARSIEVPGFLRTDAGRVRQVLLNLLGNAVKFTQRGRIELRVSLVATLPLHVEQSTPVVIAVEVTDTGPGIAADELERIFQPFEQSKSGPSHGGTGLGLSISRQIARMLGGELTVASEVGVGSRFRFVFQAIPLSAYPDPDPATSRLPAVHLDPPPQPATAPAQRPATSNHGLPPSLQQRIVAATEIGDVIQIRRLIREEVAPRNPELAQTLAQWVAAFDYPALLRHLRDHQIPDDE